MRICLEDTKVVLDPEREKAIRDKALKEGIETGELKEKRKTVIRCFKLGLDIDIIAKGTRLSKAEVKAIIDEYQTR